LRKNNLKKNSFELGYFIYANIVLYSDMSSICKIGEPQYDYTWGIALYFLIERYIGLDSPLLCSFAHFVVCHVWQCLHRLQWISKLNYNNKSNNQYNSNLKIYLNKKVKLKYNYKTLRLLRGELLMKTYVKFAHKNSK